MTETELSPPTRKNDLHANFPIKGVYKNKQVFLTKVHTKVIDPQTA